MCLAHFNRSSHSQLYLVAVHVELVLSVPLRHLRQILILIHVTIIIIIWVDVALYSPQGGIAVWGVHWYFFLSPVKNVVRVQIKLEQNFAEMVLKFVVLRFFRKAVIKRILHERKNTKGRARAEFFGGELCFDFHNFLLVLGVRTPDVPEPV